MIFSNTERLGNESSWERKVSGTKVPHRDYSFLETKGLGHAFKRLVTLSTYRCYTNNCIYLSIYRFIYFAVFLLLYLY